MIGANNLQQEHEVPKRQTYRIRLNNTFFTNIFNKMGRECKGKPKGRYRRGEERTISFHLYSLIFETCTNV